MIPLTKADFRPDRHHGTGDMFAEAAGARIVYQANPPAHPLPVLYINGRLFGQVVDFDQAVQRCNEFLRAAFSPYTAARAASLVGKAPELASGYGDWRESVTGRNLKTAIKALEYYAHQGIYTNGDVLDDGGYTSQVALNCMCDPLPPKRTPTMRAVHDEVQYQVPRSDFENWWAAAYSHMGAHLGTPVAMPLTDYKFAATDNIDTLVLERAKRQTFTSQLAELTGKVREHEASFVAEFAPTDGTNRVHAFYMSGEQCRVEWIHPRHGQSNGTIKTADFMAWVEGLDDD
jgi:hypothetical protein